MEVIVTIQVSFKDPGLRDRILALWRDCPVFGEDVAEEDRGLFRIIDQLDGPDLLDEYGTHGLHLKWDPLGSDAEEVFVRTRRLLAKLKPESGSAHYQTDEEYSAQYTWQTGRCPTIACRGCQAAPFLGATHLAAIHASRNQLADSLQVSLDAGIHQFINALPG